VNLAIMYNALTILLGVLRWTQNFGVRFTPMAVLLSVVLLAGLLVFYPRGHTMEMSPA
jgi:hypothetical protein